MNPGNEQGFIPKPEGNLAKIKAKLLELPMFRPDAATLRRNEWLDKIGAPEHLVRANTLRQTLLEARANNRHIILSNQEMTELAPDVVNADGFLDPRSVEQFRQALINGSGLDYTVSEVVLTLQAMMSERTYIHIQADHLFERVIEEDKNARKLIEKKQEKNQNYELTNKVAQAAKSFGVEMIASVSKSDLAAIIANRIRGTRPTVDEWNADKQRRQSLTQPK